MLSLQERSTLIRQWKEQDLPATTVVAKCAAGLLIVFAIALLGAYSPDPSSPSSRVVAVSSAR
jgi:hypothetical protein